MKIKRILVFLTVVGFSASLWSCTDKKGSSVKSSEETKITDISKETELPEDLRSFETVDGLFSFSTSENIMQTDTDDGSNIISIADCQFLFREEEHDIFLGIMPITDLHQTAEGFSAGLYASYDEIGEFGNLSSEALTVGDSPAYRITADYQNGYIFTTNTVQFGNGDIFAVISSSPSTSLDVCERETDIILSTVSYSGTPLKTEPETFENDYFSITIEPKWYFKQTKNDFVSIQLNLQDSIDYMMYAFSLGTAESNDIKSAADANEEKYGAESEFSREASEYMSFAAEHTHYLNKADTYVDTYFFEKNGVVYRAIEVCSRNLTDEYKKDIEEVKSGIKFK